LGFSRKHSMLGSMRTKLLAVGSSSGNTLEVISLHRLLMESRIGPPASQAPSLIKVMRKGL